MSMKKCRILSLGLTAVLATQNVLPVAAEETRISDGTRVAVRLTQQLSSATVKEGDPINFTVVEDLVINGEVVIKQGTPVRGVVIEAAEKKRMGRAGRLSYSVTETKG